MPTSATFRSDGLLLRPPTAADAEAVVEAIHTSVEHLRPWLPWAGPDYQVGDAQMWINGDLGDLHRFLMLDANGTLVGGCGLNGIDLVNRRANLGYWLRADQTGRGYATTATRLLARFGLAEAGFQRIEIIMSVLNEPSRRVAERAGATYEGRARHRLLLHGVEHDTHCYSFIGDDLASTLRQAGGAA